MAEWGLISLLLLAVVYFVAPAQIEVVVYKLATVALFAHAGYWIDRRLIDFRMKEAWNSGIDRIVMYRMLSRAIIVGAVILAGAIAL